MAYYTGSHFFCVTDVFGAQILSSEVFSVFCFHSWNLSLDLIWLWNIRSIFFILRLICFFLNVLPLASDDHQLTPSFSSAAWSCSLGRIQHDADSECKICTSCVIYHPLVYWHQHSVHCFLFPSGRVNCYYELVS